MRGGRGRSGLGSSSKRRSSVRPIPLPWAFNKILREEFQRYGGQTYLTISLFAYLYFIQSKKKTKQKTNSELFGISLQLILVFFLIVHQIMYQK